MEQSLVDFLQIIRVNAASVAPIIHGLAELAQKNPLVQAAGLIVLAFPVVAMWMNKMHRN